MASWCFTCSSVRKRVRVTLFVLTFSVSDPLLPFTPTIVTFVCIYPSLELFFLVWALQYGYEASTKTRWFVVVAVGWWLMLRKNGKWLE